ncbi:MAG: GntR family transcriptional regulator [Tissierellia bacterium]|nr:GntR family transcriptional regulator [Tissierellia bacterium]
MYDKSLMSKYEEIALDIANMIYKEDYKEGDRIHGRSTLAGMYNVSPETVRRAIKLLEDVDVVKSYRGSGIKVLSKDKAFKYINKFKNIESVASYKATLQSLLEQKYQLGQEILLTIDKIIDYSSRYSNTTAITPYEIEVTEKCTFIGQSIGHVNFWQHTGGTIVGIRRNNETILSPGPYNTFELEDVLLVIGDEKVYDAVKEFLENEN